MSRSQALLGEMDQEMPNTRIFLSRVPEDQLDWQPHEKSMSVGRLASHIAEIPMWLTQSLQTDALDLAPPGGEPWQMTEHRKVSELLEAFDRTLAEAVDALKSVDEARFLEPWSLLHGGNVIFTLPRIHVIRTMVLNHIVHHRGQLGVYYRLLGIPVPACYGPSADERGPMG